MVKASTCVIQLDELLRTSKSIKKNTVDKKEYEFNLSRYQQMFNNHKENEIYRRVALKILDDY